MSTIQIRGFAELQKAMQALGQVGGSKAMRSAAMTATLPALRNIQAAAPVGTRVHKTFKGRYVAPGFLKRNIRRKSWASRDGTTAYVIIGPASEAWYAQLLEFGKSGFARRPFLEPAFRGSTPAIIARFRDQLRQRLNVAAKGGFTL